jgi:succinyl-CoA synthetase beta subunit
MLDLMQELLGKKCKVRAHPDIQELDINPLIVSKDGLISVDARILITKDPPK